MAAFDAASFKQRVAMAQGNQKPWTPSHSHNKSEKLDEPVEPWGLVDKQLDTLSRIFEEQQLLLQDVQDFVRLQLQVSPTTALLGSLQAPGVLASALPADWAVESPRITQIQTIQTPSSSRITTSASSSGMAKQITLPHLNVYHHGNSAAVRAWKSMVANPLPPIRDGLLAWFRAIMERVVESTFFEPVMACVIGLNALNLGFAIDSELRGVVPTASRMVEHVFLCIFACELALRVAVRGWRAVTTFSAALDSLVILLTIFLELLKIVLANGGGHFGRVLEQLMVLRMARLLRLARSARFIASMESLWKLAHGLMRCGGTMASAFVLMFITIYIFACFGAEVIAKPLMNEPGLVGDVIRQHFSTMPKILLTLFQFVSMDSTAPIYNPLVETNPALAIYFLLILIFVPIALINLITAILVEDVISTVMMDDEMKHIHRRRQLKQLTPALRELFKKFDSSGDGKIQIREVASAVRHGLDIPEALQAFLDPARMLDLFDALDADNSGELSESEFVDGLTYVAMSDVDIETIQMLHLLHSLKRELKQLSSNRGLYPGSASFLKEDLDAAFGSAAPDNAQDEAFATYGSTDSEGALAI